MIDEQLAGHVEGIGILRGAIAGMKAGYSSSRTCRSTSSSNGDEARVVSHISAANAAGEPIEAEVANYFRLEGGKIAYMANFHDTRPFDPFVNQDNRRRTAAARHATATAARRVRLHRRRHRLGRARGREPPERGLRGVACWRSRRAARSRIRTNARTPALWYTLFGSEIDWGYTSVPQTALGGRVTYEPRGKMPGGSSNLYIMMHIRGHASDYDNWAYNGCPGWSYEECLPYFTEAGGPGGRHEPDRRARAARSHVSNAKLHDAESDLAGVPRGVRRARLPRRPTTSTARRWRAPAGTTSTSRTVSARSTKEGYLEPVAYREQPDAEHATRRRRGCCSRTALRRRRVRQERRADEARATPRGDRLRGAIESPHLLLLSGIGADAAAAARTASTCRSRCRASARTSTTTC